MVHSKTEHGASELHSLRHSIGRGKEIMGRDNAFGERRTERKVDDGHCRRQKKKDVIIFVRSECDFDHTNPNLIHRITD